MKPRIRRRFRRRPQIPNYIPSQAFDCLFSKLAFQRHRLHRERLGLKSNCFFYSIRGTCREPQYQDGHPPFSYKV